MLRSGYVHAARQRSVRKLVNAIQYCFWSHCPIYSQKVRFGSRIVQKVRWQNATTYSRILPTHMHGWLFGGSHDYILLSNDPILTSFVLKSAVYKLKHTSKQSVLHRKTSDIYSSFVHIFNFPRPSFSLSDHFSSASLCRSKGAVSSHVSRVEKTV